MTRWICILVCVVAVAAAAASPAAGPAPPAATRPAGSRIGLVGFDRTKRQVWFDAEVCLREGALEFLVCAWDTKKHESILHTKAKASHLHAALLMLGLTPGKPARWSGQDENARFLPPAGAGLKVSLAWKDKGGKPRRADAGAWLKALGTAKLEPPKQWIFVGSEVLPDGRYWAEVDGEVISLTNFASAVIDVPFRSSNVNEQREICANTKAIPPIATKVRVVLSVLPKAERAPHARALLEIDPFGRMQIDGRRITPEGLEKWAQRYIDRHEKGMVVIRAAGRALVQDVEAARLQLRLGGVREFAYQRIPPAGEILPRTAEAAKRALKEWDWKFANPHELIRDPAGEAQRVLDQVRLHLRMMQAREKLIKEYADHLRNATNRYKASTQPAGRSGSKSTRSDASQE